MIIISPLLSASSTGYRQSSPMVEMWRSFKCSNGTGRSGYAGFKTNYDNVLAYLLADPNDGYASYNELLKTNNRAFHRQYTMIRQKLQELHKGQSAASSNDPEVPIHLVEPRDLLNLLNYIETRDSRFSFVPRPFHRTNVIGLAPLVRLDDSSQVGCLFCGKTSMPEFLSRTIYFTTLSMAATEHTEEQHTPPTNWNFDVPWLSVYGPTYGENGQVIRDRTPLSETHIFTDICQMHHRCCPIVWLQNDSNAEWNYKHATFTVCGVTRLQHMVHFMSMYPRPRENAVWLSFANKLGHCVSSGASQCTIDNLLRILCDERIKISVERLFKGPEQRIRDTTSAIPDTSDAATRTVTSVTVTAAESSARVHVTTRPLPDPMYDYAMGTGNRVLAPPARTSANFYQEPMHVNAFAHDIVDLADDNQLFTGQYAHQLAEVLPEANAQSPLASYAVVPLLGEEPLSARINASQRREGPLETTIESQTHADACSECLVTDVVDAMNDGTLHDIHFFRLLFLQGFLIPRIGHREAYEPHRISPDDEGGRPIDGTYVCLYCCAVFCGESLHYIGAHTYYAPHQVDRLLKYALYGCIAEPEPRRVYGRSLTADRRFAATFYRDLDSASLPKRLRKVHDRNCRLKHVLMCLSSSMDRLHRHDCTFRIMRNHFDGDCCPICLNDSSDLRRRALTCGHWVCSACYNEIAITDCCLCKIGYRTGPMYVTNNVLLGYAENKHFM